MIKSKKIERIKTLIDRLENNQPVTRGSLLRVLGEAGICKLDKEWLLELNSRTYKPKEIVEYSQRVKQGLIYYASGHKQSLRGDAYKARKSFSKAESILENAVEYLRQVVTTDSSLRLWIDRDIDVSASIEFCPEGIPRPTWSKSHYVRSRHLFRVTKRELTMEILQKELDNLNGTDSFEFLNFDFSSSKRLKPFSTY